MANQVVRILEQAKQLAQEYHRLTGKPLGITGEVAEYEAARILGLSLSAARQAGYDGTRQVNGKTIHYQIKGRRILSNANPGQRLGQIKLNNEWDAVLLVLLDENFDATHIFEASREQVTKALLEPGSRSRNERGALSIGKFKSIGRPLWERKAG